jgi:hypothetical protein
LPEILKIYQEFTGITQPGKMWLMIRKNLSWSSFGGEVHNLEEELVALSDKAGHGCIRQDLFKAS